MREGVGRDQTLGEFAHDFFDGLGVEVGIAFADPKWIGFDIHDVCVKTFP